MKIVVIVTIYILYVWTIPKGKLTKLDLILLTFISSDSMNWKLEQSNCNLFMSHESFSKTSDLGLIETMSEIIFRR